jgi:hypothetical protein
MFLELRDMPQGSPAVTERWDRIVERCLPLADHIARRFDGQAKLSGISGKSPGWVTGPHVIRLPELTAKMLCHCGDKRFRDGDRTTTCDHGRRGVSATS